MAYINKSFFLQRIKQEELTKLTENSDAILDSAVASADSLIDSYLGNRLIQAPMGQIGADDYPPSIKQCSYDIAMYYLHDRIQYSEIPHWITDKYKTSIDFLTKIANGIISLNDNYLQTIDNIKSSGNNTVMNRGSF